MSLDSVVILENGPDLPTWKACTHTHTLRVRNESTEKLKNKCDCLRGGVNIREEIRRR